MPVEQGEMVWVDFDPSAGHEPAKRRPALVVSLGLFNNVYSSLVMACPITSTPSTHPLHIPLPAGYDVAGWVCVEQLSALDPVARNLRTTGETLEQDVMGVVLEAIASVFGV